MGAPAGRPFRLLLFRIRYPFRTAACWLSGRIAAHIIGGVAASGAALMDSRSHRLLCYGARSADSTLQGPPWALSCVTGNSMPLTVVLPRDTF